MRKKSTLVAPTRSFRMLNSAVDVRRREEYADVARGLPDLPVFLEPWWLDAVAGPSMWSAVVIERRGVLSVLPYVVRRRLGLSYISQPLLTQHLGPWFSKAPSEINLGLQHQLLDGLAESLPKAFGYRQAWAPEITNWLPWSWRSFKQTSRCTYRVPGGNSVDSVWSQLEGRCRNDIRSAQSRPDFEISRSNDVESVIEVVASVFSRQNLRSPLDDLDFRAFDERLAQGSHRQIFTATVGEKCVAVAYTVQGRAHTYYLLGGTSPESVRGALTACVWKAIEDSLFEGKGFDFEGSMLRPVEQFIRAFSPEQLWMNQLTSVRPLGGWTS